jgi:hypothetical protein
MKHMSTLALALLLGACSKPPPPWTFTVPEGPFSARLPGTHKKIETQSESHDIPRGQLVSRMHVTENAAYPIEVYALGHMDGPGLSDAIPNPLALVDLVIDGALKSMQARATQKEAILYDDGVGSEAEWTGNYRGIPLYGKIRCYAMHDRVVYLMFAGRKKSCLSEPEGKEFFDSFVYTGPK